MKLSSTTNLKFAPIYDSGSSLCRECTSEKIDNMIKNKMEFDAYFNRASSEIHWNKEKIGHFELITKILSTNHHDKLKQIIQDVTSKYKREAFKNALVNIDVSINEYFSPVKLSEKRKELILNLVSLRVQKLKELTS
jgi:hypothetical protein